MSNSETDRDPDSDPDTEVSARFRVFPPEARTCKLTADKMPGSAAGIIGQESVGRNEVHA